MKAAVEEAEPWSRGRWAMTVSIVVALQLALVLALSRRPDIQPRTGLNTQVILPESVAVELQALTDPMLLAAGGPHSFAAVWLKTPEIPGVDADWEEPPQWLPLDPGLLAREFLEFARSNVASLHGLAFKTKPRVLPSAGLASPAPLRMASTLRVLGALTNRTLLRTPELPSWPATDLLLPSKVRVVVDGRGRIISAILQSSSGSEEADRFAVNQAMQMSFAPASPGIQHQALTLGQLEFQWQATRASNIKQEMHHAR